MGRIIQIAWKMKTYSVLVFVPFFLVLAAAGRPCRDDKPDECKSFKSHCKEHGFFGDMIRKECRRTCGICKYDPQPTDEPHPHPDTTSGTPDPRSCGKPVIKPITDSRQNVMYGKTARRGSWPWQILMYFGDQTRCGGTIVDPYWIVTAAHCVYGDEDSGKFSVRVGEHDKWVTEGSEVDIKVAKVFRHPKFDHHTYNNDIALFKLEKPIQYNKYVSPACLPNSDIPPGTNCYVTGWGRTEIFGKSHILKQGKLPVVTNKECWIHNNHRHHPIYDGQICAGSGGSELVSPCTGDSGGPLICERNGVWELHGEVSLGNRYCSSESYGVFSRTYHYVDWIKDMMKKY